MAIVAGVLQSREQQGTPDPKAEGSLCWVYRFFKLVVKLTAADIGLSPVLLSEAILHL
jgi:hypothetical protein